MTDTFERDQYRAIAIALRPYISDTYDLLHAASAVQDALPTPAPEYVTDSYGRRVYPPATLDAIARRDDETMGHIVNGKKINAIKALRAASLASLKDAKESVERVGAGHFPTYTNPECY